jgi:hypothetical protein
MSVGRTPAYSHTTFDSTQSLPLDIRSMRSYRACLKASQGSPAAIRGGSRHTGTTAVVANKANPGFVDDKLSHSRAGLDPNTVDLLDDMDLGMGLGHRSVRRKRPLIYGDDLPSNDDSGQPSGSKVQRRKEDDEAELDFLAEVLMNEPEDLENLDEIAKLAGDDIFAAMSGGGGDSNQDIDREVRLSPAAAFGSKRVGMVVIPKELNDAIQTRVDG